MKKEQESLKSNLLIFIGEGGSVVRKELETFYNQRGED